MSNIFNNLNLNNFYSAEAEISILTSILIKESNINIAVQELESEIYFYNATNRFIYSCMIELYMKNIKIDATTLINLIKIKDNKFNVVYISEIIDKVVSYSNIKAYIKIVKEKYYLKKLYVLTKEINEKTLEDDINVEELINNSQSEILSLLDVKKNETILLKNLLPAYLNKIEKISKKEISMTGVLTGFEKLDAITGGLQKKDLIFIAGRPAMGKTAFALNIINNSAKLQNTKSLFFSLEMSKEQILNRFIILKSKINSDKFRDCEFSETEWRTIINSAENFDNDNILINDSAGLTIENIFAISKKHKVQDNINLIVIDLLSFIIYKSKNKFANKNDIIGEITRLLKQLAKELDVPVVVLVHLSRDVEKRADKRPQLSDLRDSGNIEQDADLVLFPFHENYYFGEANLKIRNCDNIENKRYSEIIIGKHRNGATGSVMLGYYKEYYSFYNTDNELNIIL